MKKDTKEERERHTHTREEKSFEDVARKRYHTSYSNIYIYTYQNEIHTLRGLQRRTTIGGLKNR